MTMLDFPGKVACTIFTYGCNFRCPFCHNATLVIDEAQLFSEEEILSLSTNCPYIGMEMKGFPQLTLVNGKIVWEVK